MHIGGRLVDLEAVGLPLTYGRAPTRAITLAAPTAIGSVASWSPNYAWSDQFLRSLCTLATSRPITLAASTAITWPAP